jgi:hypothetical protein
MGGMGGVYKGFVGRTHARQTNAQHNATKLQVTLKLSQNGGRFAEAKLKSG